MLSYFPVPYPDELFYSSCVRFHFRSGKRSNAQTLDKLFGTHTVRLSATLPTHLHFLSQQLPPGYPCTVDDFIDRHTHFPAYSAFFPSERTQHIREVMLGTQGSGINILLGLAFSGIRLHETLMYCPECLHDDIEKYGEAYWHMQHQFPGVFVCDKHLVFLRKSPFPARGLRHFYRIADLDLGGGSSEITWEAHEEADFLYLSRNIAWLLSGSFALTTQQLVEKYVAALISRDLASFSGNVKTQKLVSAFRDRFSNSFLSSLGCSIENRYKRNWVTLITNVNTVQQPIRHLLLMRLLDLNIWDLVEKQAELAPFGKGPYPCLNPVCEHYQQPVIPVYQPGYSRRAGKKPKATFQCPCCGYAYTRLGPDTNAKDRYRGKVVRYGARWDRLFQMLWTNPEVTQDDAKEQLGVGIDTLHRQAERLGLTYHQPLDINAKCEALDARDYRAIWLQAILDNPGCGVAALQALYPEVYGHLRSFDAEWLARNRPADPRRVRPSSRVRIDWEARDEDYYQRILVVQKLLYEAKNKLQRVTCNAIGRGIGLSDGTLPRDLKKLPKTAGLVNQLVESHKTFAIRRVEHVNHLYLAEGIIPTHAQFIRRAGLNKAVQVDAVMKRLDACIDYLTKKLRLL